MPVYDLRRGGTDVYFCAVLFYGTNLACKFVIINARLQVVGGESVAILVFAVWGQ